MTDHQIDSEGRGTSFRAGDLLFSKLRPYLAKSWVANRDGEALGDIHVYRPVDGMFSRYLGYLVLSSFFLEQVNASTYGTKMPRANWDFIKTIEVWVPDFDTQRRIADYLDRETATIDALIAKQVELMNRLRERRQAVIDRAFVSTSEIVILRRHLVLNDSGAWGEDPTGADDVAVLRSTEQTVDGYWAISDPALRTLSQTERQNTRLREGDLIVTKTSGSFKHVGKTTLVDNEVAEGGYGFGNFMQRLRLKSTMIPKFLWWFMRTDQARSWINLVATTSTGLMNLNGSTLGRMEVPLPSLVEQREIADHLDRETAKIDALIAKAERFIELAQERRAALITAAVTGQIEIPTED
ncbi:restriction endonuclease subunit S [Micrococcus luteus]|uniref:restriction endonuclease subunit S n=1 Tax=Micrococcus luteus TaxID=1270 RepID=UPI003250C16E